MSTARVSAVNTRVQTHHLEGASSLYRIRLNVSCHEEIGILKYISVLIYRHLEARISQLDTADDLG